MLPICLALALVMGDDPTTPKKIDVDGHSVRVRALAAARHPSPPPRVPAPPTELLKTLPLDGAIPFTLALRDETIVRTWRADTQSVAKSDLFRVAKDGTVRRFGLNVNDRGWEPVVCAKRWLVMALESSGTLIWDLEHNVAVQRRGQFGGYGNADPGPPACSPDGRYAAIATPYGGRVTVVRLEDGVVAANIPVEGPGKVSWTSGGIAIRQQMLPYE
ncbi:MAG: hypothetical protein U1F43_14645 [Myxococcota bacterium]